MKPARFDYERPGTLAEVLALLGDEPPLSKVLAGGQSLGPMLNLRLVQPERLVDVRRIPEMTRVEPLAHGVTLGACTTHADIEDGRFADVTGGILPRIAGGIAYRAVRSRGTIGGSIAHADPAADWTTCLAALGAEVLISGDRGERRVAAAQVMTSAFETVLTASEVVNGVYIPALSRGARWGYFKHCRRTGEFAEAMAAVLVDAERGAARIVLGATGTRPLVLEGAPARELFAGAGAQLLEGELDETSLHHRLAGELAVEPYLRRLHVASLKRALGEMRR